MKEDSSKLIIYGALLLIANKILITKANLFGWVKIFRENLRVSESGETALHAQYKNSFR